MVGPTIVAGLTAIAAGVPFVVLLNVMVGATAKVDVLIIWTFWLLAT